MLDLLFKISGGIYNLLKPLFTYLVVGFSVFILGEKHEQKKDLDQELEAIRQQRKREAKREMDSDSVVTDRLLKDARKE